MKRHRVPIENREEHIEPFVRSFVYPHRRARYLKRPQELVSRVSHHLQSELDPRFATALPRTLDAALIIDEARKRGAHEPACVVCCTGPLVRGVIGRLVSLDALINDPSPYPWWYEDAIVSFIPGRLAFVAFEIVGKGTDWYMLCRPNPAPLVVRR
jgi:hypothetical protein